MIQTKREFQRNGQNLTEEYSTSSAMKLEQLTQKENGQLELPRWINSRIKEENE